MLDGPVEATDLEATEENREFIRCFVEGVLVGAQLDKMSHYMDSESYTVHNPHMDDDLPPLRESLASKGTARKYDRIHRFARRRKLRALC